MMLMIPLPLFILACIQGIGEFIPVSSTLHILLAQNLLNIQETNLWFHVALHLGTLCSVLIFYGRSIILLKMHFLKGIFIAAHRKHPTYLFSLCLLIASIPAIGVGYFIKPYMSTVQGSLYIMALSSLFFGALMALADAFVPEDKDHITLRSALIIGCLQIFAFIPGASRLGTTVTAARMLRISRHTAFTFSLLVSIPVVLGAVVLTGYDAYQNGCDSFDGSVFGIWIGMTTLIGLGTLIILDRFIHRIGFVGFGLYRIALGIVLLTLLMVV